MQKTEVVHDAYNCDNFYAKVTTPFSNMSRRMTEPMNAV